MKLGKEAKVKLDNDKTKLTLFQSLLDVGTAKRGGHYGGVYFDSEIGYWYSTDGFRVFGVSGDLLPGKHGKFLPKPFAEGLELEAAPAKLHPLNIKPLIPVKKPKQVISMDIPGIVGAADEKQYTGHMTLNFENKGAFTYLGKLPDELLAPDHIHFNMFNWSHLGGYTATISYYDPKESLLVRPMHSNKPPLECLWFSLIMPTRDPGEEIVKMV